MIEDLISKYINEGQQIKAKMQAKLFDIFVQTTGHCPQDLCLVEQQIEKDFGNGFKTIYYFDWKSRHQVIIPPQSKGDES